MFAAHETEVVTQVVLIADERGGVGLSRIEIAADIDAFDGFGGGRLPDADSEVGETDAAFGGTAVGRFAREAGTKFIDCRRTEYVRLSD